MGSEMCIRDSEHPNEEKGQGLNQKPLEDRPNRRDSSQGRLLGLQRSVSPNQRGGGTTCALARRRRRGGVLGDLAVKARIQVAQQIRTVGLEVQVGAGGPGAGVPAKPDQVTPLVVARGLGAVQVAVAGFEAVVAH